jgi:hypothetical protein
MCLLCPELGVQQLHEMFTGDAPLLLLVPICRVGSGAGAAAQPAAALGHSGGRCCDARLALQHAKHEQQAATECPVLNHTAGVVIARPQVL